MQGLGSWKQFLKISDFKDLLHQIPWSWEPQSNLNSVEGTEVSCSTIGFILPRGRSQTPLLFSSVQLLSDVWLFATPCITPRQTSPSITDARSSLRLMSIKSVMPSSHLILCRHILPLPPIPPSIRVFSNESALRWGGQSTGVSALASFLSKKSQGWSPSEWTGCISLQSKGLSRVFSNTTVQKHQFFSTPSSSQSNSHIHTWPQKNHSLD